MFRFRFLFGSHSNHWIQNVSGNSCECFQDIADYSLSENIIYTQLVWGQISLIIRTYDELPLQTFISMPGHFQEVFLLMLMMHLLLKFLTCSAAKVLYHFLGYKIMSIFSVHNSYTNKSWSVDHAMIEMRWAFLNTFFPPHAYYVIQIK